MEQNANSTPPSNSTPAAAVTGSWPGAFGAFKPSREAVRRNLGTLVLLLVGAAVVSTIINNIFKASQPAHIQTLSMLMHPHVNPIAELLNLLLGAFLLGAETYTLLKGIRGQRVEFGQAMEAGRRFFAPALVLTILLYITAVVSFVLLIIPALIILPRLVLAEYYLVDQKLDGLAAYKASWHATKGNVGKVWGIIGVSILIVLPVFTIIGVIATVYLGFMYMAVTALLYEHLRSNVADQ